MRFIGNVFPRPQGLQRWELLVAWLSLAIVTGLKPASPEKEPLITEMAEQELGSSLGFPPRGTISLGSAPAAITKYYELGSLNTEMHFLKLWRIPRSRCRNFGFWGELCSLLVDGHFLPVA